MSTDSLKAAPALAKWYKKYAAKEMPDHYVCHVYSHEPGTFHSKKEIKVPADVKGMKVRTANQTIAQYVTSMGGNSVQVPIMEAYETLKSGITDAITVPWDGLTHPAFKFGTVTTYTLDTPLYVSNFTHGISMQTYDSMSDAQKKVIDQVCTPEWSARVYQHWYKDQYRPHGGDPQIGPQAHQDRPGRGRAVAQGRRAGRGDLERGRDQGRLQRRRGFERVQGRAQVRRLIVLGLDTGAARCV